MTMWCCSRFLPLPLPTCAVIAKVRDVTHTVDAPTPGAWGWTKGPCTSPSFFAISWLKYWLYISCARSFATGYWFCTFPCSWEEICKVLTIHRRFTIEFCGCSEFPAAVGFEASRYILQKSLSSTVIIIAGNILAPAAFQHHPLLLGVVRWRTSVLATCWYLKYCFARRWPESFRNASSGAIFIIRDENSVFFYTVPIRHSLLLGF